MKNMPRRTKVTVLLLGIISIVVIAYFFQAKIVLFVYNAVYKDKVQHALDVANKELDYPFALLGVKDNHGPTYKAPAICYHNEPPGVFVESVGCVVSLNADKRFNGEQAIARVRPKLDLWVDNTGKRLEEHGWEAVQFDNGVKRLASSKGVYDLNKGDYRRVTYEKTIDGVECSLNMSTDDGQLSAEQEVSLFIGGSLYCGRSAAWVL